jgi:PAS domain S-box-containing protein
MAAKSQEWFKQIEGILEMLNEGVLLCDDSGRILFVNECVERLIGLPRSAIIGKTANEFYSGKDYDFTLARMAQTKEIGHDRYEFFIPRADGTRVPVIVSSRELEGPDGSSFAVLTCTDLTEQKKAEQSLRNANTQLELHAEEIDRELALASRVQESLAPHSLHWGCLSRRDLLQACAHDRRRFRFGSCPQ